MLSLNANTFASTACSVMKTYGFQGIDIDFETSTSGAVENQFNVATMASALTTLKSYTSGQCGLATGVAPIITLTPQTLDVQPTVYLPPSYSSTTTGLYLQLIKYSGMKSVINWVQTQYYNSGAMNGYNEGTVDFITSQAYYLLNTVGLSGSQVVIALPSSSAAADTASLMSSANIANALTCLQTGSTGCGSFKPTKPYSISGVAFWAIQYDSGNSLSSAVKTSLNSGTY